MISKKLIMCSLMLVPLMGYTVELARGGDYYHGGEGREGDYNRYPEADRALENPAADRAMENRAVDDRAVNNAEAGAAAVGGVEGNSYVPVTTPQQQAPTINIYNTGK